MWCLKVLFTLLMVQSSKMSFSPFIVVLSKLFLAYFSWFSVVANCTDQIFEKNVKKETLQTRKLSVIENDEDESKKKS